MATRIEKILAQARLTLADPKKERWDDETLISILNEGLIDFCQQTEILHERIKVPISIGEPFFSLPDNCWKLTRVLYESSSIPLISHTDLDERYYNNSSKDFGIQKGGPDWELDKGIPLAIVYDRRNMLQGRVYPIPDTPLKKVDYLFSSVASETLYPTELFGVVSNYSAGNLVNSFGVVSDIGDLTQNINVTPSYGTTSSLAITNNSDIPKQNFGIIVDISDYEFNTVYGTVVDLEDEEVTLEVFEDSYGFVDTMTESHTYITCQYLKNPEPLLDVNSIIDTPSMYDIALKFYLCGQAFMNDIDTGNQNKGAIQMNIYDRHVKTAKKDTTLDWTRASQFETLYRRGV